MQLVETIEVGAGGAASIEFTSIPQDADDLLLVLSGRSSDTGASAVASFNSDTNNANYARRTLQGTGSSVSSLSGTYRGFIFIDLSSDTANTFGNGQLYIPNYTSGVAKSFSIDSVSENNATAANQMIFAGSWTGTSAITNILLTPALGNFVQYSTASLYKITKA